MDLFPLSFGSSQPHLLQTLKCVIVTFISKGIINHFQLNAIKVKFCYYKVYMQKNTRIHNIKKDCFSRSVSRCNCSGEKININTITFKIVITQIV